jgi:hypothetical protein
MSEAKRFSGLNEAFWTTRVESNGCKRCKRLASDVFRRLKRKELCIHATEQPDFMCQSTSRVPTVSHQIKKDGSPVYVVNIIVWQKSLVRVRLPFQT